MGERGFPMETQSIISSFRSCHLERCKCLKKNVLLTIEHSFALSGIDCLRLFIYYPKCFY